MTRHCIPLGLLAACLTLPVAARQITFADDGFGYNTSACAYHYVDLDDTGTPLSLSPSGPEPAHDEGGAVLALQRAFNFYGEDTHHFVVSANGYLAAAGDLQHEDGGDFRSACPLPAVPTNRRGNAARIMPLHGDLDGHHTGSRLLHQHFENCPRAATGDDPSCTVVQWRDWGRHGQAGQLDFQVVLYHGSGDLVFQYSTLQAPLSGLTTGLQDSQARYAINAGCGAWLALQPQTAVCLTHPGLPQLEDVIFRSRFEAE